MHYKKFMKCATTGGKPVDTSAYDEAIRELKSENAKLQAELSEKPKEVEVPTQTCLRDETEVNEIVTILDDFGEKYFSDIPIGDIPGPMLFNIPNTLLKSIRFVWERRDVYPDILNPAMMLYLLCTPDPAAAIGRYLQLIKEQMDDNAQAIQEDAAIYLESLNEEASFQNDSDEDDGDEDDADEAGNVASPAEYLERDHEFDRALIEGVPVDEDDDRDIPDEKDFPTINPDEVDVVVEGDCEVVAINPAQEDGEIPYDE